MLRKILAALAWSAGGAVTAALVLYVAMIRSMPELQPWHAPLAVEDFQQTDADLDWSDYLAIEERVFDSLTAQEISDGNGGRFSRFDGDGSINPARFPRNWNRSYELTPPDPRGSVLLIHGLSDSPYSTRALGELFADHGFHALGLRIPGHGTQPGALRGASWRDWRAAVRVAVRHLDDELAGRGPLVIVGYSNGAALAAEYALSSLTDDRLPTPAQLVLLSPAVAVSKVAALARFQRRLAKLPGLEKLAWTSIQPEYDPYKYNSFPVAAGEQIWFLTRHLERRMAARERNGGLEGFPPVLAFQSLVDSTIPPQGVVDRLLGRLGANGSQLVLFDVNRRSRVQPFLASSFETLLEQLAADGDRTYGVTLVTNASPEADAIVARRFAAGSTQPAVTKLGLRWPPEVYSLSHVALPFPPDDPIYGDAAHQTQAGPIRLGNLALRGETRVFGVSMDQLMRLRHNPFFSYLERRVEERIADVLRGSSTTH